MRLQLLTDLGEVLMEVGDFAESRGPFSMRPMPLPNVSETNDRCIGSIVQNARAVLQRGARRLG